MRAAPVLWMIGLAAAGAGAQEVCPASVSAQPAYARLGERCGISLPCLNADVRLDDNQPASETYEDGRHGVDLGLFCDPGTGQCKEKLDDNERCSADDHCKSRVCRTVDSPAVATSVRICIGRDRIIPGMACVADGVTCSSGLCWEDRSSPIAAPATTCRAYSLKDEPCEMLWAGAGVGARIAKHTCDPEGGSYVRFTTPTLYCEPQDPQWRPATNVTTHAEITSVGTCREVDRRAKEEDCGLYPAHSLARPTCGHAKYCRTAPDSVSAGTTSTCKDAIDEDDACDSYDFEVIEGQRIDGCVDTATCNLIEDNGAKGMCKEWFSLETGADASDPELCELEDDVAETDSVYLDYSTSPAKCARQAYPPVCLVDADCYPANSVPLVPLYCNRPAGTAGQGQCRPVVPHGCTDQWKAWRKWSNGDRIKRPGSLRTRDTQDKALVEALACCYYDKVEAGCLRDGDFVRGVVNAMKVARAHNIALPQFMEEEQWLALEEGQGADICSSSGMGVAALVVLILLGVCLCAMCVFIMVKEFVLKKKEPEGGEKKKESRRERDMRDEPALQRDLSRSGSGSGGGSGRKHNPLPPQTAAAAANGSQGGFSNLHGSPASPADAHPAAPLVPNSQAGGYMPVQGDALPRGAPDGPYPPGMEVLVWYQGDQDGFHGWFEATILSHNPHSNTYDVKFLTNELSHGVCAASIEPKVWMRCGSPPAAPSATATQRAPSTCTPAASHGRYPPTNAHTHHTQM